MALTRREQAIRLAMSLLTSETEQQDLCRASFIESVQRLLPSTGRVVKSTARYVLLESPTAEDAELARSVLRVISGMRQFPDLWVFPWPGRRSLVIYADPRIWRVLNGCVAFLFLVAINEMYSSPAHTFVEWLILAGAVASALVVYVHLLRQRRLFQSFINEAQNRLRVETVQLASVRVELHDHLGTWALLQEAEWKLRHASDLSEVYALLGDYLRRLIPECDGLSLWRLDGSGSFLELQYTEGRHVEVLRKMPRHRVEQGATGYALKTQRGYVISDLARDPYVLCDTAQRYVCASGLALPLLTPEAPIGAAMVTTTKRSHFTEYQVWAAEVLAGVVTLRIQALRAQAQDRQLAEAFAHLHDLVAFRTGGALQADPLEHVASSLRNAVEADASMVYRVTAGGDLVHVPQWAVNVNDANRLMTLTPQETPAHLAFEGCRVVALSGRELAQYPEYMTFVALTGSRSCLSVLITGPKGKAIAIVLLIYKNESSNPVGRDLLARCETYARYAGGVVHNEEQSRELRRLLGRILAAQEAERHRLALDLHDWLVQGLAAPSFRLQATERLLDRAPTQARDELLEALEELNQAADQLRRIMKGLRPYLLDDLGLVEAIRAYAQQFEDNYNIACTVLGNSDAGPGRGSEAALAAFRSVQEALNHVGQHSGATHVRIDIGTDRDICLIEVLGNGPEVQSTPGPAWNVELLRMRERAALVGGFVSITNLPEGCTMVRIQIPLSQ